MRTTLTLDEDVAQSIKELMRQRGSGLKETVNELIRRGLHGERSPLPYEPPVFSSPVLPGVDLDKALQLAGRLEDDEVMRKIEMRK
jgi:hypothetical protein